MARQPRSGARLPGPDRPGEQAESFRSEISLVHHWLVEKAMGRRLRKLEAHEWERLPSMEHLVLGVDGQVYEPVPDTEPDFLPEFIRAINVPAGILERDAPEPNLPMLPAPEPMLAAPRAVPRAMPPPQVRHRPKSDHGTLKAVLAILALAALAALVFIHLVRNP